MSEQIEFLVIEKLKKDGVDHYQASNGVRLVLNPLGELMVSISFDQHLIRRDIDAAAIEYLKK